MRESPKQFAAQDFELGHEEFEWVEPDFSGDSDLYANLGIRRGAGPDQIKSAYRRLARRYHPDVADKNDPTAPSKWAKVHDAYVVLSDPEKKEKYDSPSGDRSKINNSTENDSEKVVRACRNSLYAITKGRHIHVIYSEEQLEDLVHILEELKKHYGKFTLREKRLLSGDIHYIQDILSQNRGFFMKRERGELKSQQNSESGNTVKIMREPGGVHIYRNGKPLRSMVFEDAREIGGAIVARRRESLYVLNAETGEMKFGRTFSNIQSNGKLLLLYIDGHRLPSYMVTPKDEDLGPEIMAWSSEGNRIGVKTKEGFFELNADTGERRKLSSSEALEQYKLDTYGI